MTNLDNLTNMSAGVRAALGIEPIGGVLEMLRKQNENWYNPASSGITAMMKRISQQMKPFQAASLLAGGIQSNLANQMNAHQVAISGMTSALADIAKINQPLSDSLAKFAFSQSRASNSLVEMLSSVQKNHVATFNSFDVAIKGFSTSYLKEIAKTREWEEIELLDEVNQVVASQADGITSSTSPITSEDLDQLKFSIVTELSVVLAKTKSEKASQLIGHFIIVFMHLIAIHSYHLQVTDKTNKEVIHEIRKEIKVNNQALYEKLEVELSKFQVPRYATTNVNLRFAPKKNSQIIGLVSKGQEVTVIENHHKFLLISYLDAKTGEPKSGFVAKKYFKKRK